MKKINLTITGCMGRMGQQIIKSSKKNKSFKLVSLTENKIIHKKILGIKLNLNNITAFKNMGLGYIQKPFDPATLNNQISEILNSKGDQVA